MSLLRCFMANERHNEYTRIRNTLKLPIKTKVDRLKENCHELLKEAGVGHIFEYGGDVIITDHSGGSSCCDAVIVRWGNSKQYSNWVPLYCLCTEEEGETFDIDIYMEGR